ncbi:MAG: hypothetical protein CSYNP_04135 [Syntrophus sp. SKADARSKE-3]|nr:hypothetical protein [Syntrophus sp. SKADARSKE-3]
MVPTFKDPIFKCVVIGLFIGLLFVPVPSSPAQQAAIEAGTTAAKPPMAEVNEAYAKFPYNMQKMLKTSVVASIAVNGYKATKETYNRTMRGKQSHPSRVLARAVIGFAGCFAAGLFLGKIFYLAFSIIPFAGRVLGPIMGILGVAGGCIVGAVAAEWLFEVIVPLQAVSRIRSAVFGGVLGGVVGALAGLLMELSFISSEKGGLLGFLRSLLSSLISSFAGLFYGFLLGALAGAIAFFYIFL